MICWFWCVDGECKIFGILGIWVIFLRWFFVRWYYFKDFFNLDFMFIRIIGGILVIGVGSLVLGLSVRFFEKFSVSKFIRFVRCKMVKLSIVLIFFVYFVDLVCDWCFSDLGICNDMIGGLLNLLLKYFWFMFFGLW